MLPLFDVGILLELLGVFLTVWLTDKVCIVLLFIFFAIINHLLLILTGEQNGYNIPELTSAPDVEKMLSETGASDLKNATNLVLGEQAKRLVSDAYMCFYQSPDVSERV